MFHFSDLYWTFSLRKTRHKNIRVSHWCPFCPQQALLPERPSFRNSLVRWALRQFLNKRLPKPTATKSISYRFSYCNSAYGLPVTSIAPTKTEPPQRVPKIAREFETANDRARLNTIECRLYILDLRDSKEWAIYLITRTFPTICLQDPPLVHQFKPYASRIPMM